MNFAVKEIKAPLSVQFELTYECNNYCTFCYNVWKEPEKLEERRKKALEFSQICEIIDKITQAGVFQITLTGGEPTLHPDFLAVLEYAKNAGLRTSFITNGNLITPEFAQQIRATGVTHCQVSLHGSTAEQHERLTQVKGSFHKALNGLKYLKDTGLRVNVNMTVNRDNLQDIYDTALTARQNGASSFSVTRFVFAGSGTAHQESLGIKIEDQDAIIEQVKKVQEELGIIVRVLTPVPLCSIKEPERIAGWMSRCDGGISWCAISPSGEVRTCTNASEVAGDLKVYSLEEIWQKAENFTRCRKLEHVPAECLDCKLFFLCGGGCRACAHNFSGGIYNAPDPCCDLSRVDEVNARAAEISHQVVQKRMLGKQELLNNLTNSFEQLVPYLLDTLRVRDEAFGKLANAGMGHAIINDTGLAILELCDGTKTVGEIIDHFAALYPQPREEISKGVMDFLRMVTLMDMLLWKEGTGITEKVS